MTNAKIVIRGASNNDIPSIFSLIQEFSVFQHTPEKVVTNPIQMQEESSLFKCFVAETGMGELVGFASYFFAYYSWSGKALYLDDLYVQQKFRGAGVGTDLLNAVVALAKKENCKKVRWQVSAWNEKAIGFYKKMGASIDATEINCDLQL